MLTKEMVMAALHECYDPEIPVNVVDLGLVYDVRIYNGTVEVAKVKMVWDPPWTPDRMSDDAKKSLGFG
jgi:metal-sulfur cluster biosynthetic enzyme